MREVTQEEIHRGVSALIPFVSEWNLPLNPEDLHEMAAAVLLHSDEEDHDQIEREVEERLREISS